MINSAIYQGKVRHRRFFPKRHDFTYYMYLLALDLDSLESINKKLSSYWFAINKAAALSFNEKDYLPTAEANRASLKTIVWDKVKSLGGEPHNGRVLFVGQGRCLGLYFSPISLFYCYDKDHQCRYLLAEVSNTPWNQRHHYLIPITNKSKHANDTNNVVNEPLAKGDKSDSFRHKKDFHVSPFMEMEMDYRWVIKTPSEQLFVHLENIAHKSLIESKNITSGDKVFDATMVMQMHSMTKASLRKILIMHPAMTVATVLKIYWQALKIWFKKIPYISPPK